MKYLTLLCLIAVSACTENHTLPAPDAKVKPEQVENSTQTDQGNKMDKKNYIQDEKQNNLAYIDTVYDSYEGVYRKTLTPEEKEKLFNAYMDNFGNDNEYRRFDRREEMPTLTGKALDQREDELEKMLDECNRMIGPRENDANNLLLDAKKGFYIFRRIQTRTYELVENVQPHYLAGRNYKCMSYLYSNESSKYNLSDFEYNRPQDPKRDLIEKKYGEIYLKIKSAGLLRKITNAYYPKQFLREHADQSGLTAFIKEKEGACGCQLKHDELAAEFFGSEKKWITDLNQLINKKMISNDRKNKMGLNAEIVPNKTLPK